VAVATPAATPAAVALEVEGAPTVVRGSAVPPDATGSVIVQGQPIGPGAVNLVQTIRRRNEEQKTSSKLVTELMLGLLPGVLIYIIYVRNEWALKYCAEDLSQWVLVLALCTILNVKPTRVEVEGVIALCPPPTEGKSSRRRPTCVRRRPCSTTWAGTTCSQSLSSARRRPSDRPWPSRSRRR
jgi:hypothetical protein